VKTAGEPAKLKVEVDRKEISGDGRDLCFVTVTVTDGNGVEAARATNRIRFKVEGAGKIVATDNGDATSFEPFASHERKAFSGRSLVIVAGLPGQSGAIKVIAESDGLVASSATIKAVAASAK
jgi:beta-galactosidase